MLRCSRSLAVLAVLLSICGSSLAQSSAADAWKLLESGLADKSTDNRVSSVRLLGLLENDRKAEQLAVTALADPKEEVRAAAADALGQMKAKTAASKLAEMAKTEKEPSVVLACARSLISLGHPVGYNVFYAVLTGERKSGDSLLDSQKKMLSDPKKMAQFGFEQGIGFVPFGGISYTTFKMVTKDDTSPVRAAAAKILSKDPDPKSGEALVNAASDKSWIVRAAAIESIALRGDPNLLPRIESKLSDDKDAVRFTTAAAIIRLTEIKAHKP